MQSDHSKEKPMKNSPLKIACLLLSLAALSCSCAPKQAPPPTETASPTPFTPAPPTETATRLPTETATSTPAPTATQTPTITPTYTLLRGTVNVEKVSCRYGPGAMYLYLYGMVKGATQDILGRNDNGTWLLTQSRGDVLSCWVKSDLLDIKGNPLTAPIVPPAEYNLPKSPFYGPLTNVHAQRTANQVTISWSPLILRAGDNSLQTPYVLQLWLCQNGQLTLTSQGSYQNIINVTDEPGCLEPSHGRITAAEKHGYTQFVEIPWP